MVAEWHRNYHKTRDFSLEIEKKGAKGSVSLFFPTILLSWMEEKIPSNGTGLIDMADFGRLPLNVDFFYGLRWKEKIESFMQP